MIRRRTAPLLVLLLVGALMPLFAVAQRGNRRTTPTSRNPGVELGQVTPSPTVTDYRIPFAIGEGDTCRDPSRLHRVTLRVYNLLSQVVAVPTLAQATGTQASVAVGQPLENVLLPCAQYVAFWDGRHPGTQTPVAEGIYLYRIEVDGFAVVRKMVVRR